MASNPISSEVKIRHSISGKLDVVKGAIAERLNLEETFVRKFSTLKSYGTLVALLYNEDVAKVFPSPLLHGALPFEIADDGLRLKVIEWALPKVSEFQNREQNSTDSTETLEDNYPEWSISRHWQRRS